MSHEPAFNKLLALLQQSEEWLVDRILEYSKRYEYTKYTSTLREAWRISITMLSEMLEMGIKSGKLHDIGPDEKYEEDPIASFGVLEAQRHRSRGITISMFLGLFKYYRQAYIDLVEESLDEPVGKKVALHFVNKFFDRVELGFISEWTKHTQEQLLEEIQSSTRAVVNEKNKYLTIFESLASPALFVAPDGKIVNMNFQAARLIGYALENESAYYSTDELDVQIDWLKVDIRAFQESEKRELTFDKEAVLDSKPRIFEVHLSRMHDVSGKFTGTTVTLTEITERKVVQDALSASESKWKHILINTPQIGISLSPDGRLSFANKHFLMLTGWSEEEALGQDWFETFLPERLRAETKKLFQDIVSTQDIIAFSTHENEIVTKSGEERLIAWSNVMTRDADGRISDVTCLGIDLTERKKAEEEVRESEEKFRLITENSSDIIWHIDSDFVFTYVSRASQQMLGIKNTELIGKRLWTILRKEDIKKIQTSNQKRILDEHKGIETGPIRYDMQIQHRNGEWRWVEVTVSPFRDKYGEVVGYHGVTRDITERKQAEEALQSSERRFRSLFDKSPVGIVIARPSDQKIISANKYFCDMLGYTNEEIAQLRVKDITHPDDYANEIVDMNEIIEGRKTGYLIEKRYVRKDGSLIWVRLSGAMIEGSTQDEAFGIGIAEDITEQKRIKDALEIERRQLLSVFDSIPECIYVSDPYTYEVLFVNSALRKLYKQDPVGKLCYKEFQGLDKPCEFCTNDIILSNNGEPYRWYYFNPKLKGHYELVDRIIKWPDGRDVRFELATDVTERVKAQEELRQKAEELNQFFSSALDLLCIADTDGFFKRLNPEWETALGYKLHELEGRRFLDLVHPDDLNATMKAVSTLAEGSEITNFVNRYRHKDGSYRWIEWRSFPAGKLIYASARDITERISIEAALKNALAASTARERQISALLNASNSVLTTSSFEEAARQIFDICRQVTGAVSGYVALLSDDGSENKVLFLESGGLPCDVDSSLPMPIRGLRAEAYKSGRAVFENDFSRSEWMQFMPSGHVHLSNVMFAPINHKGKTIGLIGLANKPAGFTDEDASIVGALADVASIALQRAYDQQAVSESRELLKATQHIAKIGGWEWDVVKKKMLWTDETYYIHDLYPGNIPTGSEEHVHRSLLCYEPDDRQLVYDAFKKCVEFGEPYDIECPFTTAKGRKLWIRTTGSAVFANERVVKVVGNIIDVTEQREIEQQYQTLFNEMLNGFALHELICDKVGNPVDYRFLAVNPAFEKMTGLRAHDLIGRTVLEALPETERKWIDIYGRVTLTGEPAFFESYAREFDKYFQVSAFRVSTNQFACVFADTTESRRATEALVESEARYRAFVNATSDLIYIKDENFKHILCNEHLAEYFGKSIQDVIGKSDFELMPPEAAEECHKSDLIALKSRKVIIDDQRVGDRVFETVKFPVPLANGRVGIGGIVRDITERVIAAEALAESEERLDLAIEGGDLGLWDWNLTTGKIYHDERWAAMLGYELNEIEPSSDAHKQLVHPEDFTLRRDVMLAYLNGTTQKYDSIYRMKHKNGDWRWILDRGKIVARNEEGKPLRMVGTHFDITEQKNAQESLRSALATLNAVLDAVPLPVYALDKNGCVQIIWNKAAEQILGWSRDEVIGRMLPSVSDESKAEYLMYLEWIREGRFFNGTEIQRINKSGENIPFSIYAAPIRDEKGEILGNTTVLIDLRERKRSEAALRETEERFRSAFEHAPVGMIILAPDTSILRVNDEMSGMLGYDKVEMLARSIYEYTHPDDFLLSRQMFDKLINFQSDSVEFERRFIAKNGDIVWVSVRAAVSCGDDGKPKYIISHNKNITETKKIEAEKALLENQLQQARKLEAIGQLAGGIAHDFNNVLSPILGYSETLKDRLPDNSTDQRRAQRIFEAAVHAKDLTQQLLAFSRKQILEVKVVSLNDEIRAFWGMIRRLVREDIAIKSILGDIRSYIRADVGQLRQILMNLAVNAQDAMPNGGMLTVETEEVEITEEYATQHPELKLGRYIRLAVTDTGEGMPEEVKERIFEPFFTTKSTGKGTGLGLATVHGIVKQHGGSIWVYSEISRGTCFKLHFPACDESATEVVKPKSERLAKLGGETLLIVEDDNSVRALMCEVLRDKGYQVISEENPIKGIEIARNYESRIDMLVSDVIMPDMNGRVLYEKIAELRPGIKVLFLSGYTHNVIAHQGILDEGVSFLQKPFTVKSLSDKVRAVLAQETEE